MKISYELTGDDKIPAIVTVGKNTTPVWIQSEWKEGQFAEFINRNGCGHCCSAMALNLQGIKINPHEEFALCRKMWGEPKKGEPLFEDNFISATGIVKVMESFGVCAKAFGVQPGETGAAAKHIEESLENGKHIILWSHPSDKLECNPFSTGEHYVLLVGFADDEKILVANSSLKGTTKNGIQFTDTETIEKVIFEGSIPSDYTWGRYDFSKAGAYVVVG